MSNAKEENGTCMSAIMTENTTVVIMKMLVSSVAGIGMVKSHL
jgi:ABC-type lipoprotein release transport system permease subunit